MKPSFVSVALLLLFVTGCTDPLGGPVEPADPRIGNPRPEDPPPVAAGSWVTLQPVPRSIPYAGAAVIDKVVYVVGGTIDEASDEVLAYDPAADSWRSAGRLAYPVWRPAVAAVGERLYIFGEFLEAPARLRVQFFDPAAGTTVEGPPLETNPGPVHVAVLNGRIHVVLSSTQDDNDPLNGGLAGIHVTFDPAAGSWDRIQRAPPPSTMWLHDLAVAGNQLYAAEARRIMVYDAEANAWGVASQGAPSGLWWGRAVTVSGGRIHFFGGGQPPASSTGGVAPRATVEAYDPARDVWTTLDVMPAARMYAAAVVLAGQIYVIGGTPAGTANDRFTP